MIEKNIYLIPEKNFRKSVVGVFVDPKQRILLFQRSDRPQEWQFPQGGIKKSETPEEALVREIFEETGIKNFEILKKSQKLIRYLWLKPRKYLLGQQQTWFLLKLPNDIKPNLHVSDQSFINYEWVTIDILYSRIVDWKLVAYKTALQDLGVL